MRMRRTTLPGSRACARRLLLPTLSLLCALGASSCGGDSGGGFNPSHAPRVSLTGATPERLSEYNLLAYDCDGQFRYNTRVVPYDLNTPLFSDYALKNRAIYVPEGSSATYTDDGVFDFPVGTVLIKSFSMAADFRTPELNRTLVETRLLIRFEDGWRAFPYVWNEDLTDAEYFVRGRVQALDFVDPFGNPRTAQYLVPQKNQCIECHEIKDENDERHTTLIGPRARYLNRLADFGGAEEENQLEHLAAQGMLTGLPSLEQVPRAFDWSSLAQTGTTSLGKYTLLIRLALPTKVLEVRLMTPAK